MTRFEREIKGEFGINTQREAERMLEKVRRDLDKGNITIDEKGIARNCIG